MLSEDVFDEMQATCSTWLHEFSTSDPIANFSDYQIANIGQMLGTFLIFSKKESILIENWTSEIVVELILDYCKMSPEEPEYFDVLPETLAPFFNFLEEKEYLPSGHAISNAILAAKKDIHQTEEEGEKLSRMHEPIKTIKKLVETNLVFVVAEKNINAVVLKNNLCSFLADNSSKLYRDTSNLFYPVNPAKS